MVPVLHLYYDVNMYTVLVYRDFLPRWARWTDEASAYHACMFDTSSPVSDA